MTYCLSDNESEDELNVKETDKQLTSAGQKRPPKTTCDEPPKKVGVLNPLDAEIEKKKVCECKMF